MTDIIIARIMDWVPTRKEYNGRTVKTIEYGFACSKCGKFELEKSRYCRDCGCRYDGELLNKNKQIKSYKQNKTQRRFF